jgi:hypothetical protein
LDRKNHHTFQPLLYQVALAVLSPGDIAQPIRSILRKNRNIEVLMDEAVGFNARAHRVDLKSGATLTYARASIHCIMLPTADTGLDGAAIVPPVIHGPVFISAGDLSGCEWSSSEFNPYRSFQDVKPADSVDYSVFVYQGTFAVPQAAP